MKTKDKEKILKVIKEYKEEKQKCTFTFYDKETKKDYEITLKEIIGITEQAEKKRIFDSLAKLRKDLGVGKIPYHLIEALKKEVGK